MKEQEYFEELIDELYSYIKQKELKIKEFNDHFSDKTLDGKLDILNLLKDNNLTDDELRLYFECSNIVRDTSVVFNKLFNFIFFMNHLKVELDLDKLSKIPNSMEYLKDFKSYEVGYLIKDNKLIYTKPNSFKSDLKKFRDNIINSLNDKTN